MIKQLSKGFAERFNRFRRKITNLIANTYGCVGTHILKRLPTIHEAFADASWSIKK